MTSDEGLATGGKKADHPRLLKTCKKYSKNQSEKTDKKLVIKNVQK